MLQSFQASCPFRTLHTTITHKPVALKQWSLRCFTSPELCHSHTSIRREIAVCKWYKKLQNVCTCFGALTGYSCACVHTYECGVVFKTAGSHVTDAPHSPHCTASAHTERITTTSAHTERITTTSAHTERITTTSAHTERITTTSAHTDRVTATT